MLVPVEEEDEEDEEDAAKERSNVLAILLD